jgi:alkylation response protein AidB-like acyl-CoA dehydrogenase
MQIGYTDAQADLKRELRDYYAKLLTPEVEEELAHSQGVGSASRRVWKQMCQDGWAGVGWPKEWGGKGFSAIEQFVFFDESMRAGAPVPMLTINTVGPTIMNFGTEEQKQFFLPKVLNGDIHFCIGYSEPGAGTDLAALQTRAVRDGDEWRITGQKVWTSGAQYSDIGEIIARTDPDLPKHKGLTGFVVDMKAPGVEIRPLRQMTGGASFNEVFFTDVRVPDSHRLGDVNNGWNVALTTLMNERAAIGAGGGGGGGALMTRAIEMAKAFGLSDDPVVRQKLADLVIHARVMGYTNQRAMDRIRSGQLPGPEMSIAKLTSTQLLQRIAELASDLLGPRLTADTGEWGTFAWAQLVVGTPGMRVAGGTDEVMRNIIGERVLGLPKGL